MRFLATLVLLGLLACGGSEQPSPAASEAAPADDVNAEVEAAVRKHLTRRSDLDLAAMNLTIERVDVQGETAEARVGFQVKDTPEAAMSMDYRLVKTNGEWVVQPNATPPAAAPAQPGLPPGHPPAGAEQPAQRLPPGHPPVAQ
jgi:hypothetical protein